MKFWQKRVYADAAASTPLTPGVKREMLRLMGLYGNPGALHTEALEAKKELDRARERIAEVLDAHADEIFFTSGGTESNNLAIFGVLRALLHEHGEMHAVTTPIEHPSVLEPLRALERDGLYITYLPVDSTGLVDPKALREAVNDETAFVSVQMINSEVGTVQHIRDIAKEVRHIRKSRTGTMPLYVHTDAAQAPLWLALNVEKFGVDLMTLDAQKMMGPKGVGVLYVRRGVVLEPVQFGGGQEQGLRSGTENVLMAGACAEALAEAQRDVEARVARVSGVRDALWGEIQKKIPNVVIHGAKGSSRVANNLNVSIPGLDGQMATIALNTKGVAVSTRSACSTADETPSAVLQALGVGVAEAKTALRMSLLPDVTLKDAQTIACALAEVAQRYRNVVH